MKTLRNKSFLIFLYLFNFVSNINSERSAKQLVSYDPNIQFPNYQYQNTLQNTQYQIPNDISNWPDNLNQPLWPPTTNANQAQLPVQNTEYQIITDHPTKPSNNIRYGYVNYDDYSAFYFGSQLWKIHTIDLNGPIMHEIKNLKGTEVWDMNEDGIDIFFNNKNSTNQAKLIISQTDLTYNIMIDNMPLAIVETKSKINVTNRNHAWHDDAEVPLTWDRYNELSKFEDFYHYIIEKYPKIAELVTIGRTEEKRELKVLKLSNGGRNNRVIFIDSGVQGREWIGPAALTFAVMKLIYKWDERSDYLKNVDWYFLPVVNPDGYEYSWTVDRLWSKNRRKINEKCFGINIDRNFGYQWGKRGSSANPCSRYYRGDKRFSEPESQALKTFLEKIGRDLGAYISIGSYNQQIVFPWGDDNFIPENHELLRTLGKIVTQSIRKATRTEYKTGSSYSLKFARAGNSADWILDKIRPEYVYNFYLRDQGRYGYLLPPTFIIQSGFEVFEMMKIIAKALNIPETENHIDEDDDEEFDEH